jgi:hypothetical protein
MCAIDSCDDRFTTYRLQDIKRAKTAHKCDECHREIAAGEPYLYAFGAYEGRGASYYICAHCRVAAVWLRENCGGFLHCGIDEDIGDHINEYPDLRAGLLRFKIGMRRKWRRFSGPGLMPIPPQAKPIQVHQ